MNIMETITIIPRAMHKHNVYVERTKLIINYVYVLTAQTSADHEPKPSPSFPLSMKWDLCQWRDTCRYKTSEKVIKISSEECNDKYKKIMHQLSTLLSASALVQHERV